jgi:SAM-dependent methyltransferase
MPDQIDLSAMESAVIACGGYRRIRRYWKAPESTFWDGIWTQTGPELYWQRGLAGQGLGEYRGLYQQYLPREADVLEAGCGLGQVVLSLRHHGYRAVGLDFAKNTIDQLSERFPDYGFLAGDIRELPYLDNSFDAYISLGVIEHFQCGQSQMLREASRVVRSNGLAFVSVPAFNGYRRFRAAFGAYDLVTPTMPFFEDCYSEEELSSLLSDAGFRTLRFVYTNPVMTVMQESSLRGLYRRIEDVRYVRGLVDKFSRLTLSPRFFGHMVMAVARRI